MTVKPVKLSFLVSFLRRCVSVVTAMCTRKSRRKDFKSSFLPWVLSPQAFRVAIRIRSGDRYEGRGGLGFVLAHWGRRAISVPRFGILGATDSVTRGILIECVGRPGRQRAQFAPPKRLGDVDMMKGQRGPTLLLSPRNHCALHTPPLQSMRVMSAIWRLICRRSG